MRWIERQVIAQKVVHFYKNISNYNKNLTVENYIAEGLKRITIYDIIQRFDKYKTTQFKSETGRKKLRDHRSMQTNQWEKQPKKKITIIFRFNDYYIDNVPIWPDLADMNQSESVQNKQNS